jgi:proline racemase
MIAPERAGRARQLGSHEKGIAVAPEDQDPWVKGFLRRLSVLIHDIGGRKPS